MWLKHGIFVKTKKRGVSCISGKKWIWIWKKINISWLIMECMKLSAMKNQSAKWSEAHYWSSHRESRQLFVQAVTLILFSLARGRLKAHGSLCCVSKQANQWKEMTIELWFWDVRNKKRSVQLSIALFRIGASICICIR